MADFLKNRYATLLALAALLGVFFFLGAAYLDMPGLYYDECIFVNAATGASEGNFIHKAVFGVPVMIMAYIGALKSFLYYPVFRLFGVSAETIRLPVIMLSALTIMLAYRLGKRLFGSAAALMLAGMLATDPTFIYGVRLDYGPVALMLLFKMASLFFFFEFMETRRLRFAWLLACSLLLGFYDKLNFIWFMSALLAAGLSVYRKELSAALTADKKRLLPLLVLFLAAVTIGCIVLVVPVLSYPTPLTAQSPGDKILSVMKTCVATLNGSWPFSFVLTSANMPHTFSQLLVVPAAAAGVCVSVLSRLGKVARLERCKAADKALWFFSAVFMIVFGEIVLTKQGGGAHHLMMLYPLHYLILFAAASLVWRSLPERFAAPGVKVCVVVYLAVIAGQLHADTKYVSAFREGRHFAPAWDPAIYKLSAFLEKSGSDAVVCADWGVYMQLFSLAAPANRDKYGEGSGVLTRVSAADPLGADFLYEGIFNGRKICVVLMARDTGLAQEGGKNFMKLYESRLRPAAFVKKFSSADGKELYEVYGISGR